MTEPKENKATAVEARADSTAQRKTFVEPTVERKGEISQVIGFSF